MDERAHLAASRRMPARTTIALAQQARAFTISSAERAP
jgi:hypothetical protein